MSLVLMRRFYDKLERVVHGSEEEETARKKESAQDKTMNRHQGGGGTWKVYQHPLFFFQASPGPPSLPIFLNLVCFP